MFRACFHCPQGAKKICSVSLLTWNRLLCKYRICRICHFWHLDSNPISPHKETLSSAAGSGEQWYNWEPTCGCWVEGCTWAAALAAEVAASTGIAFRWGVTEGMQQKSEQNTDGLGKLPWLKRCVDMWCSGRSMPCECGADSSWAAWTGFITQQCSSPELYGAFWACFS